MSSSIKTITDASLFVFKSRSYLLLGILSFAVFFTLYTFVLPATYTGGRIGWISLQFLNLKLGIFAFLFSAALAFIIPFAVCVFRKRALLKTSSLTRRPNQKSSAAAPKQSLRRAAGQAGSLVGSVLPPLLCCSPFLPTVAALASGVSPFAFPVSGLLQGFIATYETQIYIAISAILAYSIYLNAKQVISAEKQICEGC